MDRMEAAEFLASFANELDAIKYIEKLNSQNAQISINEDLEPVKQKPLQENINLENIQKSNEVLNPLKKDAAVKKRRKRRPNLDKENILNSSASRTLRSSKKLKKNNTIEVLNTNDKSNQNDSDNAIDQDVISFLAEQWGKNHQTESPVEKSRKSVCIQKAASINSTFIMSPHESSSIKMQMFEYENSQKNISPIQQIPNPINDSFLEKSTEIPIVLYNSNNQEVVKPYNVDQDKSNNSNEAKVSVRQSIPISHNPAEIPLNMSCHSEEDYDFENSCPFSELQEELDENNNLVMKHPKLKSFVVTSDLNHKFGLNSERIHNEGSRGIFNELNTLEKDKLINFKELNVTLTEDNYNFKFLKSIFNQPINDSIPELTVTREADIDFENYTSPLALPIEQVAKDLEEQAIAKKAAEEQAVKSVEQRPVEIKNEYVRAKKIKRRRDETPESEEIDFAFEEAHKIFSVEELSKGIFCELDKNGFNRNRSKKRLGLDEYKTWLLKERIKKKFKINGNKIEEVWKYLRADLNKQLYATYSKR